jgi:hypothetical protein
VATSLAPVTPESLVPTAAAPTLTVEPTATIEPTATVEPTATIEPTATTVPPTLAPSPTSPAPAPVPAAGPRQSIPGLAYADNSAKLIAAFDMKCSGPVSSDLQAWQCVGASPSGNRLTAVINGSDAGHIVSLTGVVNQPDKPDPDATNFLGFVAALPFQSDQAAQAQDWVSRHLTGEGRTAIGGGNGAPAIVLSLSGTPGSRILEVYAPQAIATGG